MELDTLYADVIVERWQKLSGKAAILHGAGRTFADVRGERTATSGEVVQAEEVL